MTAAIPDNIRPRLGQFVRLLASDQAGEVVAAAAALRRALAGVGADMNDLGDAIEHPPTVVIERLAPAPRRARKARTSSPDSVELGPARRRQVVEALTKASRRGVLSAWEGEFVASIVTVLSGVRPHLSARQVEIVERIMLKIGEARPWA